ncbi:MAG TPA: hypothetical protein VHZ51_22930 [Ktedonobacteraceae bacterium]|nr:hypothetical protein [Ktedonobacteraceae bacterium]
MRIVPPGETARTWIIFNIEALMVAAYERGEQRYWFFYVPGLGARQSVRMCLSLAGGYLHGGKTKAIAAGLQLFCHRLNAPYQGMHRLVNCIQLASHHWPSSLHDLVPGSRPSINTRRKMGHASSRALKRSPAAPRFSLLTRYVRLPCLQTAYR